MSLSTIPEAESISLAGGTRGGVLLLHGYTATPQQFGNWMTALADAGFSVEAPLLPGHGTTPEEMASTTWSDYYTYAEDCYKKLVDKFQYVFVGGLCLGGLIGAWLALQYPKTTSGLLLINTPFKSPRGGNPKIGKLLLKTGKRFFTWPTPPVHVADPDAPATFSYDKIPIEPLMTVFPYFGAVRKRIQKIHCPIIVFTSKLDSSVSPEDALNWNSASGPVEQVLLERSNHIATIDYDKELLSARSLEFVNDIVEGKYARPSASEQFTPLPSTAAIEVRSLVKRYPKQGKNDANAVDHVSFNVQRGEIFGLLGPNGAGKTTTIGILTTNILPSEGHVSIMGIDVARDPIGVKQRISVVPQKCNLDQSLRAREILTFHASYHGVPRAERDERADTLLAEFGLDQRSKELVRGYSGGMAQRLIIARALMHTPDVLFLDEPTNNLDPQSRLFLWERIRTLKERGITVLLTTHDMEEASRLCDRIAIMDHGHILVCDTPTELEKLIPGGTTLEVRVRILDRVPAGVASDATQTGSPEADQIRQVLGSLPGVQRVEELPLPKEEDNRTDISIFRLYGEDVAALIPKTIHMVAESNAELRDLHLDRPSLEDVFIHLTGRNLRS